MMAYIQFFCSSLSSTFINRAGCQTHPRFPFGETPEFWDCTWFSDHDGVQICIRNVWGRRCGAFSANSTKISQLKEGTGDYVFSLARAHGVGSCQGNGRSGVATICFSEWSVFRDEKGGIENGCVPYARKKVHTYTFFFFLIMLRYVRG